jgi:hypothetical protein
MAKTTKASRKEYVEMTEALRKEYADKMQKEIQGPLDAFDKELAKTASLPENEQIEFLWGTVRSLYERTLMLEYELKHQVGLFGS